METPMNMVETAEPIKSESMQLDPVDTKQESTDTKQEEPADGPILSKNQRKKQARLQHFAETREKWKAEKREKKKAAKQRKREEGGKRKADGSEVDSEEPAKKQRIARVLEPVTLIMDCGFDELMNDKEIISMSSQLTRCYAVNRMATHQVTLRVTSLNGRLLSRLETAINNQHLRWKGVQFSDTGYEVTPENKDNLIYLTADSPDTVEDLEEGKSYIIGGIVDRNRHKSLCYNKAVSQGIRTAKLPIGEYIKMSSRFVLTTNQVVEIMLKYLDCRDWKEAFMEVIPQRKQPAVKSKDGEEGVGEEEEQDGDEREGEEGVNAKEEDAEMEEGVESKTEAGERAVKIDAPSDTS